MPALRVIATADANFPQQWRALRSRLTLEALLAERPQRLEQVRSIVDAVRCRRDDALADFTARFDGVTLSPDQFRIPPEALQKAHDQLDSTLLAALRQAVRNVRDYQQAIKSTPPADWTRDGQRLGVRQRPLRRVGVCVPGASAPLLSTVIMTVVPAQVAGVPEIAVISAPKPDCDNSIHPAIIGLCHELGVSEVYRVSGAQAVAALAFGTPTIPRVDKIVGPSSEWAQLAKREVFGLVDVDSFAGPSEVLIIADETANPAWVAADLLSQAEHAPGSALLLTTSTKLAHDVADQLESQLADLTRRDQTVGYVRDYCLAVQTGSLDETISLANEFAAEHLQIQCRQPDAVAERITNAGAIFIGPYSPVATGDYFAGPSHTLPTGGSARFFGPLSVNDFLKHSSVIAYSPDALRRAAPAITAIAHAEGLDAHARSVRLRSTDDPTARQPDHD